MAVTLHEASAAATDIREAWNNLFMKNQEVVVVEMANSVAQEVIQKLTETLNDPLKQDPTEKKRLLREVSFKAFKCEELKELAKNSNKLPPFNTWLNTKNEKENFDSDSCVSFVSSIKETNFEMPLDSDFFQYYFDLLGRDVVSKVNDTFATQKKRTDPELGFEVVYDEKRHVLKAYTWKHADSKQAPTSESIQKVQTVVQANKTKRARNTVFREGGRIAFVLCAMALFLWAIYERDRRGPSQH